MNAEKKDRIKLPWLYRLILKLPKVSLESISGDLQGVYWAVVVPIFLLCEFLLSLFLLLAFPFPINLVVTGIIPVTIFAVFVKVQLERFMTWWDLTFRSQPMKWDVKKATEEYIKLLEKRESGRRNLSVSAKEKDRKED